MSAPLRVAVIMAGGSGERFWPLSRPGRPKQLLRLTHPEKTLLQEAVERAATLLPAENIWIATGASLVEPIRAAGLPLPAENIIGEPCKRNTAGCLAYAAAHLQARYPGRRVIMGVLTADHQIELGDAFRATLEAAYAAAETQPALVTIGIRPTRAETGYGYIEVAERLAAPRPGELHPPRVLEVERFHEKPKLAAATEYVASGRFYWNSGMFFWALDTFAEEMGQASPAHQQAMHAMSDAVCAGDSEALNTIFMTLPDISIDFALLEKARHVLMATADFAWDDVGAWDAIARCFPADAEGNVALGDPVLVDTHNSIVYNEPGAAEIKVALLGVEDLVVVVSRDGVLVMPRERAQQVRSVVQALAAREKPSA